MLKDLSFDHKYPPKHYRMYDDYPPLRYRLNGYSNLSSSLGRLVNLKYLSLPINYDSDYEQKIIALVSHLPNLVELHYKCRFSTDAIWPALAKLEQLKFLGIIVMNCLFTFNGTLGFVDALHTTNEGLGISIAIYDEDTFNLTEEQNIVLSQLIWSRVGGWIYITDSDMLNVDSEDDAESE
ncbi:hypothetical protein K3495_g14076 [Podosphaera aphanis]|nr:hypothetical protein K3495_g14076 [Podosphaera aphanis]